MQEDFQAQLIKPIPMTPFALTDSFSPTFQDNRFSYLKDSKEYFCVDSDVQRQQTVRNRKPLPEKVINIVKKPEQQRTATDNNLLYRYLLTSNFFKELGKQLSPEVVKWILKEGKIKFYHSGDLLSSCGKKIKTVRILLHGQVGVMFQDEKEEKEVDLWPTLHLLVEKLGKETKSFKLKHPAHNKKNLFESIDKSSVLRRETIKSQFDIDELDIIEAQTLLDYSSLLNYQPKCSQTLIVTADSTLIMTLGIDQFYESLLVFYNSKQNQIIKLFRNVPIFTNFQNSKLKILVEKLNITEMKKNEYVYREGSNPTCFYLLTEGEVEITKTIDILEENPNNFYKNRMKVRKQRNHLNIKVLPYANFKGVYNYQKQSKIITLALINPISVFGQQELIEKTPREVNAKVISLTAKIYEITLTDIQEFCTNISGIGQNDNKMTIMDFFLLIQEGITIKKILFRQNQLSEMLHHQNKDKSKRIFQDPVQQSNLNRSRLAGKKRSASTDVPFRKINRKEEEAPPTFNNFNFTQFLAQDEEMYQSLPQKMLTSQETKVMRLTHTKVASAEDNPKKNKVKDKTIRLRNISKERNQNSNSKIAIDNLATIDSLTPIPPRSNSASKSLSIHKITLDDPLFTVNYFKTQNELQRKLFVKAKKTKLDTIYKNSKDKHQFN